MKIEKLSPAFKDYLWGGTKLKTEFGKQSDLNIVAESWELSTHPAGESRICGGEFDGMTLNEYLQQAGPAALGKNAAAFAQFPVLIKFIDAASPLSIQVHPSDEYALEVEHEYGKTEMWYVLDCEEGASLYFGVEKELAPEEFAARIENNTLTDVLRKVPVHPGDVFFIEAGTIHAIGAGILICEIQQNSNTTYRVYDYGRVGADGKPRELHVEKAKAVSRLTPNEPGAGAGKITAVPGGTVQPLAACKYFTTRRLEVTGEMTLDVDNSSFVSLVATEGTGEVRGENTVPFVRGDSLFVPAGSGSVTVTGPCTLVETRI
ncbi:MAG: class I mannose-6-phosphate isomerase [Clostridia bacterium]|nr:class I mannose-6-phosphate isomerase [Clostridia bacterium]